MTLILDTNVGEPWIDAVQDLERRLMLSKARVRVKAARDLGEVSEGLRIVVCSCLHDLRVQNLLRGFSRLQPSSEHSFLPYSNLFERASRLICKSCKRQCCSSIVHYMPFYIAKLVMLRLRCNDHTLERHDFIMRQAFVDTLAVSVTSGWASIHEDVRASLIV